jgi:hypothetical protein
MRLDSGPLHPTRGEAEAHASDGFRQQGRVLQEGVIALIGTRSGRHLRLIPHQVTSLAVDAIGCHAISMDKRLEQTLGYYLLFGLFIGGFVILACWTLFGSGRKKAASANGSQSYFIPVLAAILTYGYYVAGT